MRALFDGMMDLWDQYAMVLGEQAYDLDKHCELMRLTLLTAVWGKPTGIGYGYDRHCGSNPS